MVRAPSREPRRPANVCVARAIGEKSGRPMSDRTPEPDDLRALEARLEDMRRREAAKNRKPPPSPMGVAYRFATELVVAMVVGGGIGWGLDKAFATRPVFLIVCFLLGAAAGIRNTVRTATELNRAASRGTEPPPAADDDDEER